MSPTRAALLRSLCYFDAIDYPPTLVEWVAWLDQGSVLLSSDRSIIQTEIASLQHERLIVVERGRVAFFPRQSLITIQAERARYLPRKLRAARRVTQWLARIQGVRFVALCNTTALGYARDLGDLDFFVVTKAGTVWQTRAWATLPYKLFNRRPRTDQEIADAVCLSFFVDGTAMDLQRVALSGYDPYLSYWFLSLLPLFDDGVGESLWQQNKILIARFPFASPWISNPDLACPLPRLRLPVVSSIDILARRVQERVLPQEIRTWDKKDTSVICNDRILKFHTQDARAEIRARYQSICQTYEVEP